MILIILTNLLKLSDIGSKELIFCQVLLAKTDQFTFLKSNSVLKYTIFRWVLSNNSHIFLKHCMIIATLAKIRSGFYSCFYLQLLKDSGSFIVMDFLCSLNATSFITFTLSVFYLLSICVSCISIKRHMKFSCIVAPEYLLYRVILLRH